MQVGQSAQGGRAAQSTPPTQATQPTNTAPRQLFNTGRDAAARAPVRRTGVTTPPVSGRTRGGTGSFLDFLRVDDKLSALLPAATRMASLQSDCAALLPDMFRACAVLQFAEGQLVLAVPNAAIAARLRQKLPKLQESLGQRGWQVSNVRLKVQVGAIVPRTVYVKQAVLPALGLSAMADLESALDDSPLKAALSRLLRHQRG